MDCHSVKFNLCVLMLMLLMAVDGAVLPSSGSRLSRPCQEGAAAMTRLEGLLQLEDLADHTRASAALERQYTHIVHIARDAAERLYTLMQTYVEDRFDNPLLAEQLRAFHIDGMPRMSQINAMTHQDGAATSIRRSQEFILRVGVFLEQVLLDEVEYEVENSTEIHDDLEFLFLQRIVPLRCRLERALADLEDGRSSNDLSAAPHVPHVRLRDLPVARLRHARDYIILRDSRTLFTHITVEFATLRDNL